MTHPQKESWQEKFDRFMIDEYGKWKIGRKESKSFITSEIEAARQDERKKISKFIEDEAQNTSFDEIDEWAVGYTAALNDLVAKLKSEK